MTYVYKQQSIDTYDIHGRPVFKYVDKKQVAYGVTKGECKAKARQDLLNEKYTQSRCIAHSHHVSVVRMGVIA